MMGVEMALILVRMCRAKIAGKPARLCHRACATYRDCLCGLLLLVGHCGLDFTHDMQCVAVWAMMLLGARLHVLIKRKSGHTSPRRL